MPYFPVTSGRNRIGRRHPVRCRLIHRPTCGCGAVHGSRQSPARPRVPGGSRPTLSPLISPSPTQFRCLAGSPRSTDRARENLPGSSVVRRQANESVTGRSPGWARSPANGLIVLVAQARQANSLRLPQRPPGLCGLTFCEVKGVETQTGRHHSPGSVFPFDPTGNDQRLVPAGSRIHRCMAPPAEGGPEPQGGWLCNGCANGGFWPKDT